MSLKCPAVEALPFAHAAMSVMCCDRDYRVRMTDPRLLISAQPLHATYTSAVSVSDGLHLLTFAAHNRPELIAEAAGYYPIVSEAVSRFVEVPNAENQAG